jgi:hypothetical protein
MAATIPEITLVQGTTLAIGAQSISKPISIGQISLPNATIELPDFGSNTSLAVPGKQGTGTVTIEANFFEAEFTAILGFKTARAQKDLVLTLPASIGSGSSTGVFTASGYVMDVKTPQVQDGQTTPASYSIDFLVLTVAIA